MSTCVRACMRVGRACVHASCVRAFFGWVGGCGVVWCGVVWCGVVWCGVVWCGVVCVCVCVYVCMYVLQYLSMCVYVICMCIYIMPLLDIFPVIHTIIFLSQHSHPYWCLF